MLEKKVAIEPDFAAFLDFIRIAASIYVVLHHVLSARGADHGSAAIFRFGQEAVIVFFLLSGFVIFFNESHRTDRKEYYVRRIIRIYPTLIVSMLVSCLVYLDNGGTLSLETLNSAVMNLLMLHDVAKWKPGVIADTFLLNTPLWSLSYEVLFYLVFPAAIWLLVKYPKSVQHIIGIGCALCFVSFVVYPNHWSLVASYFIIWWVGAMLAAAHMRLDGAGRNLSLALSYLVVVTIIAGVAVLIEGWTGFGRYPFLHFRHFLCALVFALASLLLVRPALIPDLRRIRPALTFLASISYGIYIMHYPLLIGWRRSTDMGGLALAVALLLILSYAVDRRLYLWLRGWRANVLKRNALQSSA